MRMPEKNHIFRNPQIFSYLIPPCSKKARPNAIVFKASQCLASFSSANPPERGGESQGRQSSKVSEFEKQPKSFLSHVIIQCYGVAAFLPKTGAF
jgi:hypothetical protein